MNAPDGRQPLRFETPVAFNGVRALSAPLFRVRARCLNARCGRQFIALSATPQGPDDPPRLRTCDHCFDAGLGRRSYMVSRPGEAWDRECACGTLTSMTRCPSCKQEMPPAPGHGFPAPRQCTTCRAAEYLSPAGRILLLCDAGRHQHAAHPAA